MAADAAGQGSRRRRHQERALTAPPPRRPITPQPSPPPSGPWQTRCRASPPQGTGTFRSTADLPPLRWPAIGCHVRAGSVEERHAAMASAFPRIGSGKKKPCLRHSPRQRRAASGFHPGRNSSMSGRSCAGGFLHADHGGEPIGRPPSPGNRNSEMRPSRVHRAMASGEKAPVRQWEPIRRRHAVRPHSRRRACLMTSHHVRRRRRPGPRAAPRPATVPCRCSISPED